MLCQYLFECLFGAFAHLHSSSCKSAMEGGVRQQCAIEITVAHYLLKAALNPFTIFSPMFMPCHMLKAFLARFMAKSTLFVARGGGVKALLKEPEKTKRIGENAKTYMDNYNYKVAAERFVSAVKEFYKDGKISPSNSGIFSEVDVIKNNWFKSGVK